MEPGRNMFRRKFYTSYIIVRYKLQHARRMQEKNPTQIIIFSIIIFIQLSDNNTRPWFT